MKLCKNCGDTLDNLTYNYCDACHRSYRAQHKNKRNSKSRTTCVYFIRSGDLIKIGYTGDLEERKRTMQVNNPTIVEVLKTIPGGYSEEQELHKKFAHLNKTGEWFYAVQELTDFIRQL